MIKILLRTQSKWTKWLCRLSYVHYAAGGRYKGAWQTVPIIYSTQIAGTFVFWLSPKPSLEWSLNESLCSFMRGPLFSLLFNIWLVDTFYAVEPKVIAPTLLLLFLHVSLDISAKLAGKYKNCWFVFSLSPPSLSCLVAHLLHCALWFLNESILSHFNCAINAYQINPLLAEQKLKALALLGSSVL